MPHREAQMMTAYFLALRAFLIPAEYSGLKRNCRDSFYPLRWTRVSTRQPVSGRLFGGPIRLGHRVFRATVIRARNGASYAARERLAVRRPTKSILCESSQTPNAATTPNR